MKARLILSLMFLLAASATGFSTAGVVVNEIMYHPNSTNLLETWIELYNGAATNVNLTGWRISNGFQFNFPTNSLLPAGGYLVVPADAATFATQHPGVFNVVAGSAGALTGHTIELDDSAGTAVNIVGFYNDGDWAARVLTTNGFAAYGHFGWEWFAAHDGLGSSLELINNALPNTYALNWGSSSTPGGTPGTVNSLAVTNAAPLITDVSHSPTVPRAADAVTVSARIVDEQINGLAVTVSYRNATTANPPAFTTSPMYDDGGHGDGVAGDGIYGAILPPQPSGTVIEFYLQAVDLQGHVRTYPNVVAPTDSPRTANLLYQVDAEFYGGSQPLYRVIMTEMERAELYGIGRACPDSDSDANMNATFISMDGVVTGGTTTQWRYNIGARNRGHGSRQSNPNNYHLTIPGARAWKNQSGINLNSQFAFCQTLGSAVFNRTELPMADSRAVQVRVNGTNLMATVGNNSFGSYAANEQYNNDFVKRSFPLDSGGNSYRCIRQAALCDPLYSTNIADLAWHSSQAAQAAYTNSYFKQNNLVKDDWSDLIGLIGVLNLTNGTTAATYVSDVQRVINVDEWMRYMAVNTLLDNDETCLANGAGDDFALYRGNLDPRFLVLPYDLDDLMGQGLTATPAGHSIWRMTNVPVMDRFMKTPEFAPVYFLWLKTLADTTFAPTQMNPLLDQLLKNYLPETQLSNLKAFNAAQVNVVLSQFPQKLTVSNALPILNGYRRSTSPTVALWGTANAIDTRAVVVAGVTSSWTAWLGNWTNNAVALNPGINRILIQALGANGAEIARTNYDIWYDNGSVQSVGGTVAADTLWTAANGPYSVISTLTVAGGATLTIEPGTTVYLGSGVNLVVLNGGRLLAEGTAAAPVRFTIAPGSGVSWGGLTINGAAGSPETRIAYAYFEGNGTVCIEVAGGTLYLDHTTFGTTTHQYVSLDNSSFLISRCIFPSSTTPFELVHGNGGIKPGGRGIVRDCFFGVTMGNNDVMDYTGGNRDLGQPIIQYYNNVFSGATDDVLDLDGTDAWIEGNIFLHAHQDPIHTTLGTSSAISGGANGFDTSQVTIIGNIFYDCDNVAMAKEGNFFSLLNNTVVHQSHQGSSDTDGALVALSDEGVGEGLGMYLEGNIVFDAEKLVRNLTNAIVTFTNNLMPYSWTGPGGGNSTNNPLLKYLPQVSETDFSTWEQAQILRDWFSLRPDSPARGAGPNQRDQGGAIPLGASISGEPNGTNNQTTATLHAGISRSGSGIPPAGWPNGSGYTHYKWRLDSGGWSTETPLGAAINLTGLPNGTHHVDIIGKRDSGYYQDDSAFGEDALVTTSRTWTVDTNYVPPAAKPSVRLNEVLAKNSSTFTNLGAVPDMIELYNYGPASVDLSGMGLTDNASLPYKFTFPAGTTLASGAFMVLLADSATGGPYLHTGFSLKQSGDDVSLFDKPASGGALLDAVIFGQQIADWSIGRLSDSAWALCRPSFGAANIAQQTGDSRLLRINEWLADAQFVATSDFLELYNPDVLPVALGGLFLSDSPGAPARHEIAPLSFIPAKGFASFIADENAGQGADHLNFKLSADVGLILLSAADLTVIDVINYGPQQTDVSQGRSPNGSDIIVSFPVPTPGSGNPGALGNNPCTVTNITINLMGLTQQSWKYNQSNNLNGINWTATTYPEPGWQGPGQALLAFENNSLIVPLIHTTLLDPQNVKNPHDSAYYFRTSFVLTTDLTGFIVTANIRVDDGAVIYVNAVEIPTRIRMNPGTVAFADFANSRPPFASGDAEGNDTFTIPSAYFVQGTNYLAAEVHQADAVSSDIVWGMALDAIKSITNCAGGNLMPIVLNEVLASNSTITNGDGTTTDWIELYNPSTNSVDLSDTSLSNDPSTPRKFVFAPGMILGPGGFKGVDCDGSRALSSTNTGFSLSAKGGAVYFFDRPASGGGLLDALSFGLQTPDYSLGRIPNGTGLWTLNLPTRTTANAAAGLGSVSSLKVNEWMADLASGSDWFEIYNAGAQPVALGGLFLTDDLNNHFQNPIAPLSFIGAGPNGFLQFFADSGDGYDHVSFSLKKGGEAVGIFSPAGTMLDGLAFGAQITGVSQGRFPDGGNSIVSFTTTASPGESNYLPLAAPVVNEVLTHTDPPLEDAVELFNPSPSPVNIGGWYLSNSKDNFKKFRIPDGTVIGAHGFAVFYEYQFNLSNGEPFTFNSAEGDSAILAQADPGGNLTGYRAQVSYGAAENGAPFGRYQTSVGTEFTTLRARTFGADQPATLAQFRTGAGLPNAYPKVGPVIVSEIMYYSTTNGFENPAEEFVELANLSGAAVPLYDPVYPTNTWRLRDAVAFQFPTNVTLAANSRLLVVGFSPTNAALLASLRSRFNVPAGIAVYGPWSGRLANDDDSVELVKPDAVQLPPHPDAGLVPQVLVDKVHYSALAPWPSGAAAGSNSLQRIVLEAYGNDPENWLSAPPSAGRTNNISLADSDADGLPDTWEMAWFGTLARNGTGDFDGDGQTDSQEYLAGTSPVDPASYLKIDSIDAAGGATAIHFTAAAGKTYSVLFRNNASSGTWARLTNVPAQSGTAAITVNDPTGGAATRFYRLVTPNWP